MPGCAGVWARSAHRICRRILSFGKWKNDFYLEFLETTANVDMNPGGCAKGNFFGNHESDSDCDSGDVDPYLAGPGFTFPEGVKKIIFVDSPHEERTHSVILPDVPEELTKALSLAGPVEIVHRIPGTCLDSLVSVRQLVVYDPEPNALRRLILRSKMTKLIIETRVDISDIFTGLDLSHITRLRINYASEDLTSLAKALGPPRSPRRLHFPAAKISNCLEALKICPDILDFGRFRPDQLYDESMLMPVGDDRYGIIHVSPQDYSPKAYVNEELKKIHVDPKIPKGCISGVTKMSTYKPV